MGKIYGRVAERIGEVYLPAKPQAGGEYTFPEDPTLLSIDAVGRWLFTLTAWNGYALRNLALADLAAAEAEDAYEQQLQQTLTQIEDKRRTRNQLQTEALALNPKIMEAKTGFNEARAEVAVWGRLQKLYEAQVAVLSREITRRSAESQSEGRGRNAVHDLSV